MRLLKRIFKKKTPAEADPLEQKLDIISELTKGLGKKEFKYLINAVEAVFEARQNLRGVKTEDEKEYGDINDADRKLEEETK